MNNAGRVIYDLGANRGNNLEYYLRRADRVVAVEANPSLGDEIAARFPSEINAGRVCLVRAAVTDSSGRGTLPFYVHKSVPLVSTVEEPRAYMEDYEVLHVPSISFSELIERYGRPYFVKVDLEGHDVQVLNCILTHADKPDYISVECHDPAVLGMLAGMGGYTSYKFVRGKDVGVRIKNLLLEAQDGEAFWQEFVPHSAGPFGEDIPGPWLNKSDAFDYAALHGPGWYDVSAKFGAPPQSQSFQGNRVEIITRVVRLLFPRTIQIFRRTLQTPIVLVNKLRKLLVPG